tara:strand:- start:97 stop:1257 length:1161 start_codon:yes stop_codon:yes gene_type:complete
MSISIRNIFSYDSLLSKRIQLDNREYQIRQKERDLLGQALAQRNAQPDQQAALIRSQRFFEFGFEEGFKRAQAGETEVPDLGGLFSIFAGALLRGNVRAKGGPVKKGEPYVVGEKGPELIIPSESGNVIPNDEVSPYFEASIGRDSSNNIVTESFFDTGKGRISDFYEEKTSDGKVLFSDKTEMIGSSMTQSYYDHYSNEEKYDDGGAETFTETSTLTTKISSIAKDDLIKHQDQLLSEIHKIKGFEDVTIDDVLKGTTGLPKDTMFNILSNSDASYATAARTDEQNRMPTDYLVNTSSDFKSEAETRYNSEGLVKGDTENNEYSNLASSINQSVDKNRVKTVIQPVIQNQITQVPTPVPIAQPVNGSVTRMKASQLPNNIAKLIQ